MTLGSHQAPIGRSQAHITPRFILEALTAALPFDLDPCAADPRPWDCARVNYTEREDGLALDWFGRPWVNPPFHRHHIASWVDRLVAYGRGTLLVHARTETAWFAPILGTAAGLLMLRGRVTFLKADGSPQTISNPRSKHFGKPANSGAPVWLVAFGGQDLDVLADCGLAGEFVPLRFARGVLITMLEERTWREVVREFLRAQRGPIAVADLYRAFAGHPKTKANPNWRPKLRQTLQRGAGRRIAPDRWVVSA